MRQLQVVMCAGVGALPVGGIVLGCVGLLAAGGCGGTAAIASRAPAGDASLTVTLHPDGAIVREVRRTRVPAGVSTLRWAAPADVLVDAPGSGASKPAAATRGAPRLRVVDGAGVSARAAQPARGPSNAPVDVALADTLVGAQLELITLAGAVTGRVVTAEGGALAVAGEGEGALHVIEAGDAVTGLASEATDDSSRAETSASRGPALLWTLAAERAGAVTLEQSYATGGLSWRADYTVVLAAGRERADLDGWLTVSNRTAVALPAARVAVTGERLTATSADEGARAETVVLGGRHDVAAGRATRIPLVRARDVPVRVALLYDPVGEAHDRHRRTPDRTRDLVPDDPGSGVRRSVELDADSLPLAGLPPGRVRVLAGDAEGRLVPMGEVRGARADRRGLRLAVGRSAEVRGARRQSELTVDERGSRLLEEIVVTLHNAGPRDAVVLVREHMYRGLNWALAYHSEVESADKAGPQAVHFRVRVPAAGDARLVYRVVYTW